MPNSLQRLSGVSWTQRTPAGLPSGIPGIGEEIEGAMQHAAQPIRHSMASALDLSGDPDRSCRFLGDAHDAKAQGQAEALKQLGFKQANAV